MANGDQLSVAVTAAQQRLAEHGYEVKDPDLAVLRDVLITATAEHIAAVAEVKASHSADIQALTAHLDTIAQEFRDKTNRTVTSTLADNKGKIGAAVAAGTLVASILVGVWKALGH